MKSRHYIYTSLTRISDLEKNPYDIQEVHKDQWKTGDYILCKITDPGSNLLKIELPSGRMRGVIGDEYIVGALGERFATLEATGTWRKVGDDLQMHVLTGAGLFGKLTSKSVFVPSLMEIKYRGHVSRNGKPLNMLDFVQPAEPKEFTTPVVLFIGTSMSAGKTTSARIVTHIFKTAGYKVVGGKLTGAGRYKDILALKDVGADAIYDFVDVGLPSTVYPTDDFAEILEKLLHKIASVEADIAIIEIGASPMEPYNGDIAFKSLKENLKCVVLSATDPYSVYGIMKAYEIVPDLVTGIASNTLAGREMVEKLCGVQAINFIDSTTNQKLRKILSSKTGLDLMNNDG